MGEAKRKKMSVEHRAALNAMCDRMDARMKAMPFADRLSRVKAIVDESLKFPGTSEETKLAILVEMENGGYEALLRLLMDQELPPDFDPDDRPWNRN